MHGHVDCASRWEVGVQSWQEACIAGDLGEPSKTMLWDRDMPVIRPLSYPYLGGQWWVSSGGL